MVESSLQWQNFGTRKGVTEKAKTREGSGLGRGLEGAGQLKQTEDECRTRSA